MLRYGEAGIERSTTIKQQHPYIEGVPDVLSREQFKGFTTFAKLKEANEINENDGMKQESISIQEPGRTLPKKTGDGFYKDAQRALAFRQQHPGIEGVPDELSRKQFNRFKKAAAKFKTKQEGMEMTKQKTENLQ